MTFSGFKESSKTLLTKLGILKFENVCMTLVTRPQKFEYYSIYEYLDIARDLENSRQTYQTLEAYSINNHNFAL